MPSFRHLEDRRHKAAVREHDDGAGCRRHGGRGYRLHAAAYVYSVHHFETLLDSARRSALAEGDLIRVALEHQMIENDRTPDLADDRELRKAGARRATGGSRSERDRALFRGTTRARERLPYRFPHVPGMPSVPAGATRNSRVIETRGGTILRTVIPIRNRAECYRCHDASHRINGILILDYDAGEIPRLDDSRPPLDGGRYRLADPSAGRRHRACIRVFVLRRLQKFETTARQIAAGDLERRVPAQGHDTLAWLANEFNTMADSVTGLVGEVRNQRERLETVINSIDDGIVVLDPQRKIIAANDAFLRRAKHSREQVLGCCCRDVGPGVCEVGDCPTLACLRSGERQVRICERRTPDGGVAWEEVHASPVLDDSGSLLQIVEVWRDISERRAAEAHLAESHRLASVGMLASGFSHELNTPLATVLTCVEGILRGFPADTSGEVDRERIRENASIAREQILRCRGITQHFLRMSRGQKSSGNIVDPSSVIAGGGAPGSSHGPRLFGSGGCRGRPQRASTSALTRRNCRMCWSTCC